MTTNQEKLIRSSEHGGTFKKKRVGRSVVMSRVKACLQNPEDMRELHKCGLECGDIYWEREKLDLFGMLLDPFLETCDREELFDYAGCDASVLEDVVVSLFY